MPRTSSAALFGSLREDIGVAQPRVLYRLHLFYCRGKARYFYIAQEHIATELDGTADCCNFCIATSIRTAVTVDA